MSALRAGKESRTIPRPRPAAAAYFLAFLGVGIYLPYIPLYLARLGYSGWQIGLVVGTQPLVRWTSAIGWAYVADRWRIRRWLLVGLALGGAVCLLPMLVVRSFPVVALVLAAVSICHGPVLPMLDASVIDNLPQLGGDYGRLRLWGSAGFIVGAAASAPLVAALSAGIVPLLLLIPNLLLAPALLRLPSPSSDAELRFRPPWRLLTPPLAAMFGTVFLVELSSGAWNGFFALHTSALGLPDSTPGVAWGLAVLGEVLLFRSGGGLLAWLPVPRIVVLATAVTAARWALSACVERQALVIGVQLAHAVTFSALHLAAQALIARFVPPDNTTGGQALYGMARFGAGGTAGVWLAGALVDWVGTRGLFVIEALVALAALIPALRLRRLVD